MLTKSTKRPPLKPLKKRQFTAPDGIRCEASIPHGDGETAQCRRSTVAGRPYCAQHDKMARERVEAGRKVIAEMKRNSDH